MPEVTSKNDSRLPNTPVSDGRGSPDLIAERKALKQRLRDINRMEKAESIRERARRARERQEAAADAVEALRCRIYKALWSAKAADALNVVEAALAEFKTNSVDQQYTLAAMKARSEAKALADAARAEQGALK